MKERRNKLLTEEQINKVLKINSCLEPKNWNKGMYDAFIFGYQLGKVDEIVIKTMTKQ